MMATEASTNLPSALQQRLLAEQMLIFCRLSHVALVGGVFAGMFVCFLLLREHTPYRVGIWYALLIAITVVRIIYQKRITSGEVDISSLSRKKVLAMLGVNGVIWSLPGTWLMPLNPINQVVLSLFVVGLSATSLTSLTSLRNAASTFLATMMLPIGALYFWMGEQYATSAIGIVAYTFFMIAGARRQTEGTEELLRLQLDNAALAAKVQREKEVVERANRDLQLEIEQRERTESALRASKAEAEAANNSKSQFLAKMSHELRTPLNGILGTSELLMRSLPNMGQLVKHVRYAQTIRSAGDRLLHLINDILDMARIEAGALRLEASDFKPRELIDEVADLLTAQCAEKGLALSINVSPQVPTTLHGDPNRLRQILSNLVANAIKFTEHGGVEIRVVCANGDTTLAPSGVVLRWSVTDTGIGIAEAARSRLFQPFSQLDDSSTRKFGGTGLGLAICHQLVRAMRGRIDVETIVGHGSTFWFELPFEVPAETETVAAAGVDAGGELTARVLIAEDNATNSQLVAEMLALAGCKATIAANGREAIHKLEHDEFDLVLMDWHMPQMDGVVATRTWREHERSLPNAKRIPIIALTASVLPGDRDTCLRAGMDDFLAKPFSYDELFTVVQRWLPRASVIPDPTK